MLLHQLPLLVTRQTGVSCSGTIINHSNLKSATDAFKNHGMEGVHHLQRLPVHVASLLRLADTLRPLIGARTRTLAASSAEIVGLMNGAESGTLGFAMVVDVLALALPKDFVVDRRLALPESQGVSLKLEMLGVQMISEDHLIHEQVSLPLQVR